MVTALFFVVYKPLLVVCDLFILQREYGKISSHSWVLQHYSVEGASIIDEEERTRQ